jgi:glutathione S-transferase
MFESGAILLHLALKHNQLIPKEDTARANTLSWMFAALNSIEPFVAHYFLIKTRFKCEDHSTIEKLNGLIQLRLGQLSKALGKRLYLQDEFTVADILMTTVLKHAYALGVLSDFPNLIQYKERHEARPAFKKAMEDHEKLYKDK